MGGQRRSRKLYLQPSPANGLRFPTFVSFVCIWRRTQFLQAAWRTRLRKTAAARAKWHLSQRVDDNGQACERHEEYQDGHGGRPVAAHAKGILPGASSPARPQGIQPAALLLLKQELARSPACQPISLPVFQKASTCSRTASKAGDFPRYEFACRLYACVMSRWALEVVSMTTGTSRKAESFFNS